MNIYIAVDFDGTIAEHEYPLIGPFVPGALEWMKRFQDVGAKLILWTIRSGMTLKEAVAVCRINGIEFFGVNTNPTQGNWTDSPKVYAHAYIDDAAVGCPLIAGSAAGSRSMVNWAVVGPHMMDGLLLPLVTRSPQIPVHPGILDE